MTSHSYVGNHHVEEDLDVFESSDQASEERQYLFTHEELDRETGVINSSIGIYLLHA